MKDAFTTWVIQKAKQKSVWMTDAMTEGSPGKTLVEPRFEDIGRKHNIGIAGIWPTTVGVLKRAVADSRDFVFMDNGYFRGYPAPENFFRATINGLQHPGYGYLATSARWDALKLPGPQQWKKSGKYILVVMQSEFWYDMFFDTTVDAVVESLVGELRRHTDRQIKVRRKPVRGHKEGPLDEDLRYAHAVVAFSSNVLLQAVVQGIPIFPLMDCAASAIGCRDLSKIEKPLYPEGREEWLWTLADNQWTLDEIRTGKCWNEMWDRYDGFRCTNLG